MPRSHASSKIFMADLTILGSAFCFGIGFLGQRAVMVDGLGPMTCNAFRFGLSTILLILALPWLPSDDPSTRVHDSSDEEDEEHGLLMTTHSTTASHSHDSHNDNDKKNTERRTDRRSDDFKDKDKYSDPNMNVLRKLIGPLADVWQYIDSSRNTVWYWGIFLGCINMGASGFQQWGISMTEASKVAFIAGFDLFLTPMFACCIHAHKAHASMDTQTWVAVCLSVVGIFFLSGASLDDLSIGQGETLTLISTVFWTLHITYTDIATNYIDTMHMMCVQLGFVTFCSSVMAFWFEPQEWLWAHMQTFFPWLLFLAVSEGLGFVLMALGQNVAPPTHAAIILSLEGVFAAFSSYLVLGEELSFKEYIGCGLMLASTLIAEVGCGCLVNACVSVCACLRACLCKSRGGLGGPLPVRNSSDSDMTQSGASGMSIQVGGVPLLDSNSNSNSTSSPGPESPYSPPVVINMSNNIKPVGKSTSMQQATTVLRATATSSANTSLASGSSGSVAPGSPLTLANTPSGPTPPEISPAGMLPPPSGVIKQPPKTPSSGSGSTSNQAAAVSGWNNFWRVFRANGRSKDHDDDNHSVTSNSNQSLTPTPNSDGSNVPLLLSSAPDGEQ